MAENISFDYYYGSQAEQFSFYRIPKLLLTHDYFKKISSDAKILYGIMLDRMSLSMKNRWVDKDNRVYIIFTVENVLEMMCCSERKAINLLGELDMKTGIGLIEKKRQGLGKPNLIYVKNFLIPKDYSQYANEEASGLVEEPQNCTNLQFKNCTDLCDKNVEEVQNIEEKGLEIQRLEIFKPEDYQEINEDIHIKNCTNVHDQNCTNVHDHNCTNLHVKDCVNVHDQNCMNVQSNYTNNSYTDNINTNLINLSKSLKVEKKCNKMVEVAEYENIIKSNIEYEYLINEYRQEEIDELVTLMLELVSCNQDTIWIAGAERPFEMVKGKFMKLNYSHIQYVMDCLNRNIHKISNIKSYLLTALFNAPSTINQYYKAEVKHDKHSIY